MPDREAAPRRRRRGSNSQNLSRQPEWSYEPDGRHQRAGTHRMGIPRILGRRARWFGARLRREV